MTLETKMSGFAPELLPGLDFLQRSHLFRLNCHELGLHFGLIPDRKNGVPGRFQGVENVAVRKNGMARRLWKR
jgi:hypothetical protein